MLPVEGSRRQVLASMAIGAGLTHQGIAAATGPRRDMWDVVRASYLPQNPLVNLNNAGVSPQPIPVQDAFFAATRFANGEPDVNMWEVLDSKREHTKAKLAAMLDCDPADLVLNRNSTEGLCTAIYGIDLNPGDEVLVSPWDYDSMKEAWALRARRHGIVIAQAGFDPMADDDAIFAAYRAAITPRTRVMQLTHMNNVTGRVIPVAQLCELARSNGIRTIVDAAQSFAQMPISIRELGCDYFAASLHKWLCAPFGTGLLYVRKEHHETIWPLVAPLSGDTGGLARIDGWNLGTYASPAEAAIDSAIDFHNAIGTKVIHARLQWLSRYWIEKASNLNSFRLHTPVDSPHLSALALFSLEGQDPQAVERRLRDEFGVRVRYRKRDGLEGLRVSPHIYTSTEDLDRLIKGIVRIAGRT